MNDNLKKVLIGVAGAALTGLVTWAGLALRRAARNVGRTELEIALDDLKQADAEERAAAATAEKGDDDAAKAHKLAAQKKVEKAKRLKALLDAGADAGETKDGAA